MGRGQRRLVRAARRRGFDVGCLMGGWICCGAAVVFFSLLFFLLYHRLWTRLKGGPCLITVGTVVTVTKPLEWKTNWTIQIPFHLVISGWQKFKRKLLYQAGSSPSLQLSIIPCKTRHVMYTPYARRGLFPSALLFHENDVWIMFSLNACCLVNGQPSAQYGTYHRGAKTFFFIKGIY
jgi:hypothetical protein